MSPKDEARIAAAKKRHEDSLRTPIGNGSGRTVLSGNGRDGIHAVNSDLTLLGDVDLSNNGRHGLFLDGSTLNEPPEPAACDDAPNDPWHKKPIGMIGIGIATTLLAAAALSVVVRYFG